MAERPDLSEIERCLKAEGVSYVRQGWAPIGYQRTVDLLRYCRELEAENKRLGKRCVELAREFEIDLVKRMSE